MSSGIHGRSGFEAELDLGARLYASERRFEARIDGRWVLFAPDAQGPPWVVDGWVRDLAAAFEGGARAGDVLARMEDATEALDALASLEARGLVGAEPRGLPYPQPRMEPGELREAGAWIQVTDACNLACPYCFVRRKDACDLGASAMESMWAALAGAARNHGLRKLTLKFAGGEPTLRMDLVEAFRNGLEKALDGLPVETDWVLITNGTFSGPAVFRFLDRPATSLCLSLDGIGATHGLQRAFKSSGASSWPVLERNVEALLARGIRPALQGNLTGSNRQGIIPLVRWALDRRLPIHLNVVVDPAWTLGWTAYGEAMGEAFAALFRNLEAGPPLPDPLGTLTIGELKFEEPAYGFCCGIGQNYLVFRTDGTLVPCPMRLDRPGTPPGEDALAACREIAFVPGTALRRHGTCLACRWYPVCTGGCPVEAEKAHGDPFAPSPLCAFHRLVIPRFIAFAARQAILRAHDPSNSGKEAL